MIYLLILLYFIGVALAYQIFVLFDYASTPPNRINNPVILALLSLFSWFAVAICIAAVALWLLLLAAWYLFKWLNSSRLNTFLKKVQIVKY